MANPRKFSEKIALHNQKQAEETAAFEAIIRDVSAATRGNFQKQNQHLHIQHNLMQQYRGGSLPNVNQMATASNSGIDLQALQHLEGMRGGSQARVDRMYPRDRGRQIGPLRSRQFQTEKSRADCSPYGSGAAYLSPPPDTSWRRTNSDSAIHSSLQSGGSTGEVPSPNTPPVHRRIHEVVGENSGMSGDMLKGPYPWDPKKLQQRPKSCEVPNINIYPSAEQDSQVHIPISNNTGSLPDLTILQFPSPLTTPLDVEDQNNYSGSSPSNLSPTSAHHLNMGPPQHPNGSPAQSPGSQRRRVNPSGPSPLVLQGNGTQSMRLPHSPPVPNIDPSTLQMDARIRQQYMLYIHQQRHGRSNMGHNMPIPSGNSPTHQSSQNHSQGLTNDSPRVPPSHLGPVPKVCVTSHENDPPEPSLTQYRNNISDSTGCQSPTSPHSQPSYSPSQSPGLPPQSSWNNVFDMDSYNIQQQQQTNALQQQFEHFNMIHDNQQCPVSNNNGTDVTSQSMSQTLSQTSNVINTTTPTSTLHFSQAYNNGLSNSQDFRQQQFYMDNNTLQSHMLNSQQTIQAMANSKIPDIILTGSEETVSAVSTKVVGNPLAGMGDGSFDADLFGSVSDEALKDGLVPLDLDGLQMLTDPTMVADADTENSFRLDQL